MLLSTRPPIVWLLKGHELVWHDPKLSARFIYSASRLKKAVPSGPSIKVNIGSTIGNFLSAIQMLYFVVFPVKLRSTIFLQTASVRKVDFKEPLMVAVVKTALQVVRLPFFGTILAVPGYRQSLMTC